jgi:hypothetical protein
VVEVGLQRRQLLGELARELGVGLGGEQLVQDPDVVQPSCQPVVPLDVVVQAGELGRQALALGRVVPDPGFEELVLEVLRLRPLAIEVKGTPSRRRSGGRCPRSGR